MLSKGNKERPGCEPWALLCLEGYWRIASDLREAGDELLKYVDHALKR